MGLRQNVFEAVYTALTNAYLLSSTVTVTAAFIDRSDAPFPQVVVHPVDVNKDTFTYDRTYSRKDVRIMIDIWTKKNKEKDQIADQIDAVLESINLGYVQLVGWTESNALEPQGGNKIHLKSIILDFMGG
jgi:hypothetical protein